MSFHVNFAVIFAFALAVGTAQGQVQPSQDPAPAKELPDAPQPQNMIHIHVDGIKVSTDHATDPKDLVEQVYGSPFSVWIDDTGVAAPGWLELNTTVNAIKTDQKQIMLPLIDANLGYLMPYFNLDCQLKVETPPVTLEKNNSGGDLERVVGPSAIGSKCVLYDNEGHKLSIAVYPEYDWDENGQIQHFRIPLLGVKEFKNFSITLNVGYNRGIGNAKTFWDGGVGIGHRISDRNAIFVGTYATGEDNTEWIEFGFRRKFGDNNLNLSYSHTVGGTPYAEGDPTHKTSGQALSLSWQISKHLFQWKEKSVKDGTASPQN